MSPPSRNSRRQRFATVLVGAVLLIPLLPAPARAQAARAASPSARQALFNASRALSDSVSRAGISRALPEAMTSDGVILYEGAPIVRGRAAVATLLGQQPSLGSSHIQWQAFRVVVSSDSTLGVTFGATVTRNAPDSAVTIGRYVSVWRFASDKGWRLAAHVEAGLGGGAATVLSPDIVAPVLPPLPAATDPFVRADIEFAAMARDKGAPVAFGAFAAPDGMTLAGTGELNIGPTAIRERLTESRAGSAAWKWWPVLSLAAGSGDLGVTIGEADITAVGSNGSRAVFPSKYLTVWQRQPDGAIRYIVDAGNSRPAR